jgi:hypothetical protein
MDNCPPSGSTWIYGPCETFSRQAIRKFSRFYVSIRRGLSVTYLSTPFDHQRNEEEIARERNDQVHIKSVEVEITDDLFENSVVPSLEIEDEDLPIEYQGAIINWLQREYGEHVEVIYTLYE